MTQVCQQFQLGGSELVENIALFQKVDQGSGCHFGLTILFLRNERIQPVQRINLYSINPNLPVEMRTGDAACPADLAN
jgi:hypothetical protein